MLRLSEYIRESLQGLPVRPFFGTILIWNLTQGCNLFCAHCYASSKKKDPRELTTKECLELIDQFLEIPIVYVILSGGEPLLRADLVPIIEKLRSKGIQVGLSTNGVLLTKERAEELKGLVQYIGISIDGPEEVHDQFRGQQGAYRKSLKALLEAKELGIPVGLRFTIAPPTAPYVSHLFELAEKYEIQRLYFSHLVPSGRARQLGVGEIEKIKRASQFILEKAFFYVEKGKNIQVVTGNNPSEGVLLYLEFQKRYPKRAEKLWQRLKVLGGDRAGDRIMNITALGDVKPDPFFPSTLGNVRKQKISRIWGKKNKVLTFLREPNRRILGPCGRCPMFEICRGGSRSRSYILSGRLDGFDPLCLYSFSTSPSSEKNYSSSYNENGGS